jgi:hypothetical protein
MDYQTTTLLVGVLFLLMAIVGGGFTAREVTVPPLPRWARIVSAVLGIAFLLLFASLTFAASPLNLPLFETGFSYTDNSPDTNPQNIAFVRLEARAQHNPPRVKDSIQVKFSIRNAGSTPLQLDSGTFLSARSPDGRIVFVPRQYPGRTIQPGEVLETDTSVKVDSSGQWLLGPCYKLMDSQGGFCPSEWKSFVVNVP